MELTKEEMKQVILSLEFDRDVQEGMDDTLVICNLVLHHYHLCFLTM